MIVVGLLELDRRILAAVLEQATARAATGVVVASGSSCRQQIADLTGRVAEHPAVVVDRRLRES